MIVHDIEWNLREIKRKLAIELLRHQDDAVEAAIDEAIEDINRIESESLGKVARLIKSKRF